MISFEFFSFRGFDVPGSGLCGDEIERGDERALDRTSLLRPGKYFFGDELILDEPRKRS